VTFPGFDNESREKKIRPVFCGSENKTKEEKMRLLSVHNVRLFIYFKKLASEDKNFGAKFITATGEIRKTVCFGANVLKSKGKRF
jgi:hypothetical protein